MRSIFILISFYVSISSLLPDQIKDKVRLEVLERRVEQFAKCEFIIYIDRSYQNPFDPNEVDVSIELTTPKGRRITYPAFYHQPYEMKLLEEDGKKSEWIYPQGKPGWRARFSPTEPGKYSCIARVKDEKGVAVSNSVSFECVPSKRKGFIKVSSRDARFLEFSNGEPFFAIGQNLAFLCYYQYINDLQRADEVFSKLKENGANFIRVWTCCGDWALALEYNKSVWERSWLGQSPLVPNPDGREAKRCVQIRGKEGTTQSVSPCSRIALKPKTTYRLTISYKTTKGVGLIIEMNNRSLEFTPSLEWCDSEAEFTTGEDEWWLRVMSIKLSGEGTAWIEKLSLREIPDGPELLWEADVNRPELGMYNLYDAFLLDKITEIAEKRGIYLQICLLNRDPYMNRLNDPSSPEYDEAIEYAKRIFRYAIARWGASTAVAVWEFVNEMNPNLPTDRFYEEVGRFIKRMDIYQRPITTSAWSSNPRDWRLSIIDIANEHFYMRPSERKEIWEDEVRAVLERAEVLRKNTPSLKPIMIAEFGLATDEWGKSPYMDTDNENVHFHNSLWASALSGTAGTAMFWWWETLDNMGAYKHYKPLAEFLKDIPFTRGDMKAVHPPTTYENVEIIGLQGRDCAFLWFFDHRANWFNRVTKGEKPQIVRDVRLELKGLKPGRYKVRWWDTWRGKEVKVQNVNSQDGIISLAVPNFLSDIACQVLAL